MSVSFSEGDVVGGKYRLETHLDGGGFGDVFIAKNMNTGRNVALKTPKYGKNPEQTVDKYFSREKEGLEGVQAQGGHPNIMGFKEAVSESGALCLALEFVQGDEFGEYLQGRSMDFDEARRFGIKLSDAIAFLHEEVEVMYRDLKLDNVLIDNGEPILIDFTTVKKYDTHIAPSAGGSAGSGSNKNKTEIDGGNGFKPPELTGELNKPQGPWTDVYSIGRILLYATVGYAPKNDKYSPPSEFMQSSSVPDYFDGIIAKSTKRDPSKRYGSAYGLKRALDNKEPVPPKQATLEPVTGGRSHTITPGHTIGRSNKGPTTNIELNSDHVSAVHCRFDLDAHDDWILVDKSLNGTYVNKANESGANWHCIRSSDGQDRLRQKGRHQMVNRAEGESIGLDNGDTIALVDPDFGGGADSWYRFEN
jgi:serine/threonine protein kinase